MIKQLLNLALAKYRDLSVARRTLFADAERYFAQPRPIIDNYYIYMVFYQTAPTNYYIFKNF